MLAGSGTVLAMTGIVEFEFGIGGDTFNVLDLCVQTNATGVEFTFSSDSSNNVQTVRYQAKI